MISEPYKKGLIALGFENEVNNGHYYYGEFSRTVPDLRTFPAFAWKVLETFQPRCQIPFALGEATHYKIPLLDALYFAVECVGHHG